MKRMMLLFLCLVAIGCDTTTIKPDTPEPVTAHCDPVCFDKCSTSAVKWDVDPEDPGAWDALVDQVTIPLIADVAVCDARRAACATCLDNLKRRRVIR